MFRLLTFALLLPLFDAQNVSLHSVRISNFHLLRCSHTYDDTITLEDVTVQIDRNNNVLVSGIFTTEVDLYAPIKAFTEIDKKVVFWIKLPCMHNVGTCTYRDICAFGVPESEECPDKFVKNNVPCRCPIKKGTYVFPNAIMDILDERSIISGLYKGNFRLYSGYTRLACYTFNFILYDSIECNLV